MSLQKKQKTTNLLTICIKSGKVIKGFDSVCEALKGKTVSCVMTASDISPKSLKETVFMCNKFETALINTDLTKEEMAQFTGKHTAVLAVCDKGFADKFIEIAASDGSNT